LQVKIIAGHKIVMFYKVENIKRKKKSLQLTLTGLCYSFMWYPRAYLEEGVIRPPPTVAIYSSPRNIILDVTLVIYNFTILYWTFSDCEGNTYKTLVTKKVIKILGNCYLWPGAAKLAPYERYDQKSSWYLVWRLCAWTFFCSYSVVTLVFYVSCCVIYLYTVIKTTMCLIVLFSTTTG